MRRFVAIRATILAMCASASLASLAATDPNCAVAGAALISPAHPGPADLIGFQIPVPAALIAQGERVVATAFLDASTNSIYFAATITPQSPSTLAGRVVPDPRLDNFGVVGPLAPGTYNVYTTVLLAGGGGITTQPVCDDAPAFSEQPHLVVGASAAAVAVAPIVEYYDAAHDHYFNTQDPGEIRALDSGAHPGWVRTGQTIPGYVAGQSDNRARPAARYYGSPAAGLDTHFFTIRSEDPGPAWVLETSDAFELAQPDTATGECSLNATTIAVYRLWNQRADSNHRYTTDLAIRQQMIARGWAPEGYGPASVMLCAPVQ